MWKYKRYKGLCEKILDDYNFNELQNLTKPYAKKPTYVDYAFKFSMKSEKTLYLQHLGYGFLIHL